MENMLRVGFLGAGFVANFHLKALQSVRGVELTAVHALKGTAMLQEHARALGVGNPVIYDNIGDLCKRVDVVAVFLPNFVRTEAIRQIVASQARNLRGIIMEKPFARNVAEANEILTQIIGCGWRLPGAYFENQIFMPAVRNTRAQLHQVIKKMGPVSLVRTAEEHGGPHEPWFWNPTMQGGGVWCDMGCHSVAVGEDLAAVESSGQLIPISVSATMGLLKWGNDPWLSQLRDKGVDYVKTPAEDFAQVSFVFENSLGRKVVVLATDSWMYEAPGLRLSMEAMGPGYSLGVNTLQSAAGIFISDAAAESVGDAELALEKSQASRGQLVVQPNEADLYGYINEWRDAIDAFNAGQDGLLDLRYGARVVKLVMAAYMAHERAYTLDLKRGEFLNSKELDEYVPAIQAGNGAKVL